MPATTSRTAEALEALVVGVQTLTSSTTWQRYLEVAARFRTYSFGNVVLLLQQRPDATRVAGFNTWRKLGRHVLPGEKALWVLAPITRVVHQDDAHDDGIGGPRGGRRVAVSFKAVPVWDLSQTGGEPLPSPCRRLAGDAPSSAYASLERVAAKLGYTVDMCDLPGERNGDCTFDLRRIRVRAGLEPAQAVKTLAHEIAHAKLHADATDRALAELEAESVAFVVCRALQIDAGAYSFGYVTSWAGGGDGAVTAIRASGGHIHQATAEIIAELEGPA